MADQGTSLGGGECIHETDKAILVRLDSGEELWIPNSQVHEDSDVYGVGDAGDVIVSSWWARQKGLG